MAKRTLWYDQERYNPFWAAVQELDVPYDRHPTPPYQGGLRTPVERT